MEEIYKDDVAPGRWIWCVINNMQRFNDKPEYMVTLFNKFHKIKDHKYLSAYKNVIDTTEEYYNENKRFPDIVWLRLNFKNIRGITKTDDKFSMQIYDSLIKYIDQEVLRDKINRLIMDTDTPKVADFQKMAEEMINFSETKDSFKLPSGYT